MSEYPKHFPPFMRDFHNQKDVVKAFYTWLDLADTVREKRDGKKFDDIQKRRVDTCSWVDFHILMVSFLDFLHALGYKITKERGADISEFDQDINTLKELPHVLYSLIHPSDRMVYAPEYCVKIMDACAAYHPYLTPEAVEAYRKLKAAQEGL